MSDLPILHSDMQRCIAENDLLHEELAALLAEADEPWNRVREAHAAGDLAELRALALLAGTPAPAVAPAPAKNEALARLMDAGKLLFAKLASKSWQDGWLRVGVRVCLRDH